jgi:hypothetical protein
MAAFVIEVAAGFGKTAEAIQAIAESRDRFYEVYVATLCLAEEWKQRILELNPDKVVSVIYGRSAVREGREPPCRKHELAEQLTEHGFSIFPNLCLYNSGNEKPAIACEHWDSCAYINQFDRADVHIYTHSYLPLGRNLLQDRIPDVVVIDESFWAACIEEVRIPLALLTHQSLPETLSQVCTALSHAITTAPQTIGPIIREARDTMEYEKALTALRQSLCGIKPSMTEREIKEQLKRRISFTPVAKLLAQLGAEAKHRDTPQSIDYDHDKGVVTLQYRMPITRFSGPYPGCYYARQPDVVILDASASHAIISRFFEIKHHYKIRVKRNARVVQCISTRCSTTSITPDKNSNQVSREAAQKRLQGIQQLIDTTVASNDRVLVGGPSAVVGNTRTDTESLLINPSGEELAHFGAIRGIDSWKDCDTVIVIGRNQPPANAVENYGRALYHDDPQPLMLTGEWIEEARGYSHAKEKIGVMVQVHPDSRMQEVHEQLREHETLQLVDRARLIHNDQTKTVILLSNLPLDIDVDELPLWNEIINGGNRLERAWAAQTAGVMPLNPAWLAEHHADLWPSMGAAKQDVGRERRKGQTSNSIYIRNLSLFEYQYKTASQRNWSRCLSQFPAAAETEEVLQRLLGQAVKVRSNPAVGEVKKPL